MLDVFGRFIECIRCATHCTVAAIFVWYDQYSQSWYEGPICVQVLVDTRHRPWYDPGRLDACLRPGYIAIGYRFCILGALQAARRLVFFTQGGMREVIEHGKGSGQGSADRTADQCPDGLHDSSKNEEEASNEAQSR